MHICSLSSVLLFALLMLTVENISNTKCSRSLFVPDADIITGFFHKNSFTFSPSSIKRCIFLTSFSSLSLYPCTCKDCSHISQASPTAIGMILGKVGDVTPGCFSARDNCCHISLSHSCAITHICIVGVDTCHIFGDTFISNKKVL